MMDKSHARLIAFRSALHSIILQRLVLAAAMLASPVAAYAQTVTGGESPATMVN